MGHRFILFMGVVVGRFAVPSCLGVLPKCCFVVCCKSKKRPREVVLSCCPSTVTSSARQIRQNILLHEPPLLETSHPILKVDLQRFHRSRRQRKHKLENWCPSLKTGSWKLYASSSPGMWCLHVCMHMLSCGCLQCARSYAELVYVFLYNLYKCLMVFGCDSLCESYCAWCCRLPSKNNVICAWNCLNALDSLDMMVTWGFHKCKKRMTMVQNDWPRKHGISGWNQHNNWPLLEAYRTCSWPQLRSMAFNG